MKKTKGRGTVKVKMLEENEGITLIALVITIVVLLILAGITIVSLTSENGVLRKAIEAKRAQEEAELYERIQLIVEDAVIEKQTKNSSQEEIKNYIQDRFEKEKLEAIISNYEDGYMITYGIYTKKRMLLDSELRIIKIETAVVGTGAEWEYTINEDGSATLTAYKKEIKGNIDIPNIVDEYAVTKIGDDIFNYATQLTGITIPEGITSIGARTFAFCSNLEWNISFPQSLQEIGEKAFYGCEKITGDLNVLMTAGISYGKGVFMKCNLLTGDIQILMNMLNEDETVISESLFNGFSGLTGILVIPERITAIQNNAFYGCSGITKIEFESNNNLTEIGDAAFYQCSGLTGVLDVPDSVTKIGQEAFYENTGLTGLELPSSLADLGSYAFYHCTNIQGIVTFSTDLSEIKEYTFYNCWNLERLVFDSSGTKGVKIIKQDAFFCCSKLKTIEFPNNLQEIEQKSFYQADLENIIFPDSLTKIGNSAFSYSNKLDIIHWSSALKTIGSYAFRECTNLKTLPDSTSLVTLNEYAFGGCTLLGTNGTNDAIEWIKNSSITKIGDACFKNCTNLIGDFTGEIDNKDGQKVTIEGSPFVGTKINLVKTINLEGKTKIENNEFAGATKLVDAKGQEVTEIVIPDTVTFIGTNAFSGCSSVTSIQIPNSVTSIGNGAFSDCIYLTKFNFPENKNYTSINSNLLKGCTSLKNITIPNNINTIGSSAIYETGIEKIIIPGNVKTLNGSALANNYNLTEIKLEEGIDYIGSQAFRACEVVNLEIPDSVTKLESTVFHYMGNLETLTIGKGVTILPERMLWSTQNVKNVTIKGNITKIEEKAFQGLRNLSTLNMDWSSIIEIQSKAFDKCSSLKGSVKLNLNCSIAEDAFDECGLTVSK